MSKCRYDLSEDCHKKDCVKCVLDKIKAEIEQTANEEQKHDEKWAIGLRYAVKIIDKYKAESEKWINFAENLIPIIDDVESEV